MRHNRHEIRAAAMAAARRGAWVQLARLATVDARGALYRLRTHVLRQRTAGVMIRFPAPDIIDDSTHIAVRAARRFRQPPAAPDRATYRIAGGQRAASEQDALTSTDPQDRHSWARLAWAAERDDAPAAALLDRWLEGPPEPEVGHPYATSERIRFIAGMIGRPAFGAARRDALARRLACDAIWLAARPETQLGVHNHLLNNAAALVIAAALLPDHTAAAAWRGQGRALWDTFWPQLLLPDGALAEGSSHYHVLLTRTMLEYLSDAEGRVLPAPMDELAPLMCTLTDLLVRPDGSLPLFGDISPDLPMAWMRGISRAAFDAGQLAERPRDAAAGYAAGAPQYAARPLPPRVEPTEWHVAHLPHAGLLHACRGQTELIAHGDPRPHTAIHADAGRGSFEVWHRGAQLIVDGGVPTYAIGSQRARFRSAEGQNTIAIDTFDPAVIDRDDLPTWYGEGAGGAWELGERQATFRWHGFERRHPGLVWSRIWRWGDGALSIEDVLAGSIHRLSIRAILRGGDARWREHGGSFCHEGVRLTIDAPQEIRIARVPMERATDYGVLMPTVGFVLSGVASPPIRWRWNLELE